MLYFYIYRKAIRCATTSELFTTHVYLQTFSYVWQKLCTNRRMNNRNQLGGAGCSLHEEQEVGAQKAVEALMMLLEASTEYNISSQTSVVADGHANTYRQVGPHKKPGSISNPQVHFAE